MKKRWILFACIAVVLAGLAVADDGMWLYNAVPKDKIKARYGFEPTTEWLDHVRLSSVRFNNGGSGSFVSPDGLVMTNHHVGAICIHQISTNDKDYMKLGFYARTQADEPKCPDLELNVLMGIEDITDKVNAGVKPGAPPAEIARIQRNATAALQKECAAGGLRCDVLPFYSGTIFHLYKYKKYTDVRLVFAPEYDMAFFGGDPDNFEFPRYDLDMTFFRIYENDKPIRPENYFKWSPKGAKENELIFVSGHPGSTGRLNTMAQLEFLRDVQYPTQLASMARRIAVLKKFSSMSEENARIAERQIFGLENSQKATKGYYAGLLDKNLMAIKAADEKKLRDTILADPKLKAEFGDPWTDIAESLKVSREMFLPSVYIGNLSGFGGALPGLALNLVRAGAERAKPNAERATDYRDSALPSLEQKLFSPAPLYKTMDEMILADSMAEMNEKMPGNPLLAKVLNGRAPAQAAKDIISNTKMDDVEFRKQLYTGGKAAIENSTDPLIVLMRTVEAESLKVRREIEKKSPAAIRSLAATNVAKARFAVEGLKTPPDATFTLRLSYGAVKGFLEDGQGIVPKGTKVAPFTTMGQAFDYAAKHGNSAPYKLPESWMKAKNKINPKTPFNFTSTADIIGGNSGSPVVNKKAEIVGLIFDGNIQSLPGRFLFEETMNRAVSVDSRAMIEALRKVYNAEPLADELSGKTTAAKKETKKETAEKKNMKVPKGDKGN